MTITWLIILLAIGVFNGFDTIDPSLWFLLAPFLTQDLFDMRRRR